MKKIWYLGRFRILLQKYGNRRDRIWGIALSLTNAYIEFYIHYGENTMQLEILPLDPSWLGEEE